MMAPNLWNENTLDRHSPIPLYQQLSDILMREIKRGALLPGSALPSENELVHIFGVSRYVIRQTLNNLSHQGLIFTEHGRGSFVSYRRIDKPLDVLQSYHKNMRTSGLEVEVEILSKQMLAPPEEIAHQLALPKGQRAFYLERVAYLDGAPVNLLTSYIADACQEQALMSFTQGSLYDYLSKVCKISLDRSRGYIEVVFAGERESRTLKLPRGSVLLQIVSLVFNKDGLPVEYSQVIYPGSMFRFWFDSFMGLRSTSLAERSIYSQFDSTLRDEGKTAEFDDMGALGHLGSDI